MSRNKKPSSKQSNLMPRGTRKRTKRPIVSRKYGIIKIRMGINKIEMKKTVEKVDE